jgi:hypothetical protein
MPLFSSAELTQRDRVYVVLCGIDTLPTAHELADRVPGENPRRVDVRSALLDLLSAGPTDRRLQADDVLYVIQNNLVRRGIVLFPHFVLPLAFFGEAERAALWRRLLTEVLDRPGLGVLLLPPESRLLPSSPLREKYAAQIRYQPTAGTGES